MVFVSIISSIMTVQSVTVVSQLRLEGLEQAVCTTLPEVQVEFLFIHCINKLFCELCHYKLDSESESQAAHCSFKLDHFAMVVFGTLVSVA